MGTIRTFPPPPLEPKRTLGERWQGVKKYAIPALLGSAAGLVAFSIGVSTGYAVHEIKQPTAVIGVNIQYTDFNNDERVDQMITDPTNGEQRIFIKLPNGTYDETTLKRSKELTYFSSENGTLYFPSGRIATRKGSKAYNNCMAAGDLDQYDLVPPCGNVDDALGLNGALKRVRSNPREFAKLLYRASDDNESLEDLTKEYGDLTDGKQENDELTSFEVYLRADARDNQITFVLRTLKHPQDDEQSLGLNEFADTTYMSDWQKFFGK